jgi:hypothetical protein
MTRRRTADVIDCLEQHPNSPEILAVLARLPHIADSELPALASAWHNTLPRAEARNKALQPDSPLVLDVLAAFEAVQSLFADDMRGGEDYVTVDPRITTVALKAVRDAIAAAYASPILSPAEHQTLFRAWRTVYPLDSVEPADLGTTSTEVSALLSAIPQLADRCHDPAAAARYADIRGISASLDRDMHAHARDEAWQAAVLTSRRRVWGLVRRIGTEGMNRYCPRCRRRDAVVLDLCLDAACGLLVADAIDDTLLDVLTLPVMSLLPAARPPAQRPPTDA